jgi:hypothetical protein
LDHSQHEALFLFFCIFNEYFFTKIQHLLSEHKLAFPTDLNFKNDENVLKEVAAKGFESADGDNR